MKAVIVEWIDSHQVQGWTDVAELPDSKGKKMKTLGWLVEESKNGITVSSSLGFSPTQVCGTMIIPKEVIVSMEEIYPKQVSE